MCSTLRVLSEFCLNWDRFPCCRQGVHVSADLLHPDAEICLIYNVVASNTERVRWPLIFMATAGSRPARTIFLTAVRLKS